jgi:hypothetical protein
MKELVEGNHLEALGTSSYWASCSAMEQRAPQTKLGLSSPTDDRINLKYTMSSKRQGAISVNLLKIK